MKAFKKLATLSMAVLMAFGVSALAACDKGGDSATNSTASETTKTYTCYEFVVVNADGTKVGEGYSVQLCKVNEDGTVGSCLRPIATASGACKYNEASIKAPGVYEAHVLDAENNPVDLKETVRTSADAFGEYTLTIAAANE